MAQHTPGPWDAPNSMPDAVFVGDECIAICETEIFSDEINAANARLMAAAPDMLAALKGLVENPAFELSTPVVDGHFGAGKRQAAVSAWDGFVEAARSAIAKAEGRS